MSYIVSWSGGKDSCLALLESLTNGYNITHLVNFISEDYERVRFHGTEAELIRLQSKSLNIPLVQVKTSRDGYEQEFKEAIRSLIPHGVEGMVFGDIDIQENRDWVEKVCKDVGIIAKEPLWGKDRESLLKGFIDTGFEAVIVSANARLFGYEWIGHKVDNDFLSYLKENNIDICGENGEYHTFVTDGSLFQKKIRITMSKPILRNGYWLLDTMVYSL